jgi:ABC-type nitrate/sulfonate/bicarbonate transport system substrate-binding protein
VNSAADRPWSQHFCCFATANREFVRQHPVAVKRALRAILKATGMCAAKPDRAARTLVDKRLPRLTTTRSSDERRRLRQLAGVRPR